MMNKQDVSHRIYYLSPRLCGPISEWPEMLDHAAQLGFDHVLLAPVFARDDTSSLFLTGDFALPDPGLGWSGDSVTFLARVSELGRARGLGVLLDVVLDRIAAHSPLMGAHPDLFTAPDDDVARDPRRMAGMGMEAARVRWDVAEMAARLVAFWRAQIREWAMAGLAGARLLGLEAVPSAHLRDVIAGVHEMAPDFHFLGWAPGISRTHLKTFAGAGLDLVFSSLPWWNFYDGWLWDEAEALHAVADIIAAPEAPFGPRLARRWHDPSLLRAGILRSLGLAAAFDAAWMMPMGVEYGARRELPLAGGEKRDFVRVREEAPFDLGREIAGLNAARAALGGGARRLLNGPGTDVLALLANDAFALLNKELSASRTVRAAALLPAASTPCAGLRDGERIIEPTTVLSLAPGELRILPTIAAEPVRLPRPLDQPGARAAAAQPRIAIEAISPSVDQGRFPARRIVGESVTVTADLICDGHGELAAVLRWRASEGGAWHETNMRPLGNDRWQGELPLSRLGRHEFTVCAWYDAFATFREELAKKHAAGLTLALELEEGRQLVAQAQAQAQARHAGELAAALAALLARLDPRQDAEARRLVLMAEESAALMREADVRPFLSESAPHLLDAERQTASFASWYEIFPRSMSDDINRHGNFDDVIRHLPRIRAMGFDVLYFPPIHPIGETNRKGRNNAVIAAPSDPGSPYAIGGAAGGHDAVHPDLGKISDFRRLRDAAAAHGLEIALDFAIQCSPDHPWLREHRDWFDWRSDGSLRYAENPPKKYEDIVNVDFYAEGAVPELWLALRDIVLFWLDEGVRLFRVDNPHTKPLPFWHWLIEDVRARDPAVVFLAEAFTRPKMMYRLAKIGFSQSYTYFTWRNTREELEAYFKELVALPTREFFRPHLFVNTPDINPYFLQSGGRGGFLIRAALAATLSGLWGVYCGFELCEAAALPGREEYLDSEKYQIRAWDWQRPGNIVSEITRLNKIRRDNPALHSHLGVRFCASSNPAVIAFCKVNRDHGNILMVVISLDPHTPQTSDVEIPLWEFALADDAEIRAKDLMAGETMVRRGKWHRIALDPASLPFVIWRLSPAYEIAG